LIHRVYAVLHPASGPVPPTIDDGPRHPFTVPGVRESVRQDRLEEKSVVGSAEVLVIVVGPGLVIRQELLDDRGPLFASDSVLKRRGQQEELALQEVVDAGDDGRSIAVLRHCSVRGPLERCSRLCGQEGANSTAWGIGTGQGDARGFPVDDLFRSDRLGRLIDRAHRYALQDARAGGFQEESQATAQVRDRAAPGIGQPLPDLLADAPDPSQLSELRGVIKRVVLDQGIQDAGERREF
jgi:hypothetical protein